MRTTRGHRSAAVLVTAVVLALVGALLPSSAQAAPTTGNDVLRGVRCAVRRLRSLVRTGATRF
jgi:hypothetical protein